MWSTLLHLRCNHINYHHCQWHARLARDLVGLRKGRDASDWGEWWIFNTADCKWWLHIEPRIPDCSDNQSVQKNTAFYSAKRCIIFLSVNSMDIWSPCNFAKCLLAILLVRLAPLSENHTAWIASSERNGGEGGEYIFWKFGHHQKITHLRKVWWYAFSIATGITEISLTLHIYCYDSQNLAASTNVWVSYAGRGRGASVESEKRA